MTTATLASLLYAVPLLLVLAVYRSRRNSRQQATIAVRDASAAAGLSEPPSLHPVVDPGRCIGCGLCVAACPEQKVLGTIGGKAQLVSPSHCIGHGACQAACPVEAITLVFGTERRGVDIPFVGPDFQTNVPGIFIAGELGGMGLIRNAIQQGRQAVESVARLDGLGGSAGYDVVVVGAGPAGFAASLSAMQHGLRYLTLDQETFGGTVAHYPRGKLVMTAPAELPLIGRTDFRETTKEALLAFWQDVVARTGVAIRHQERVEAIAPQGGGFVVHTPRDAYPTRAVVLAIGRRGSPRKLEVPGEESSKVVYRLVDPSQYRGRKVLVVGGGDSALEAAVALAGEPGTTVTLSYRGETFARAKQKNRQAVEAAAAARRLDLLMTSNVEAITESHVRLEQGGRKLEIANDAVVVAVGGVLPTRFLKEIGIEVETKYGTA